MSSFILSEIYKKKIKMSAAVVINISSIIGAVKYLGYHLDPTGVSRQYRHRLQHLIRVSIIVCHSHSLKNAKKNENVVCYSFAWCWQDKGFNIFYKIACAPRENEASHQSAHLHSLIRVFPGLSVSNQGSNVSSGRHQRLWSLHWGAGWSEFNGCICSLVGNAVP